MSKLDLTTEVSLKPLISIVSAAEMDTFRYNFQTYSETPISFKGREYTFVDSSVVENHSRQTQFSPLPHRIVFRNASIPTQRTGIRLPGLEVEPGSQITIKTPLELVKTYDGLRRCSVEINYVYENEAGSTLLDRTGKSLIVETRIKGSAIEFKLNTVLIPKRPVGLVRVS